MALPHEPIEAPTTRARERVAHWPAAIGFVVMALLMTLPAAPRLATHFLGAGDAAYFVWELWWFHHAAFVRHVDPLVTPMLYHPNPGVPLIWSTPINLLPGMVLVGLLGPVMAYNTLVLGGLALAGYGAYRLAWAMVGDRRAAFLAGMIFALAPAHMAQLAGGHLGVMSVQWVPFCALALMALFAAPTWRRAAAFAVTVALVAATDLYVAAYFFGTLGVAFLGYYAWRDRARLLRPAFMLKAAIATVIGLAATLPFHLATWRTLQGAASNTAQAATVDRFGQDLLQLLLPAPGHPLLGWLSQPLAGRMVNTDSWGTLGLVALGLAFVGLWRRRDELTRFWGLFTGLAVIGSLGTWLHVAGAKLLPMPYMLAVQLPVIKSLRVPGRLAEIAALGLAMLTAAGAAWLFARLGSRARWAFAGLGAAIALEYAAFMPFPTTSAAVPAFYCTLAADPGAGAILELPNGDENWGGPTHRWMFYQTVHAKPLVFGHTHRVPNGAATFYWSDPVVSRLAGMAYGNAMTPMPAGIDVPGHLAAHGIGHVTLHRVPGMLDGETYRRMRATLVGHLGAPAYEDSDMVAFATRPHVGAQLGR